MLVKTGLGSISFVAGCCWVNSVVQPPPLKTDNDAKHTKPFIGSSSERHPRIGK